MRRWFRRALSWKFVFYELLLPLLRLLGPARCDAVLRSLGQASTWLWPGRKQRLIQALRGAGEALDLDPSIESLWPALAADTARFLARDCTLDGWTGPAALDRFDVHGDDQLEHALGSGKGVILVGSHMGAYIAGLHWLFRRGLPIRAIVQRPPHASRTLSRLFDQANACCPQADLFVRREVPRADSIELMIRARLALNRGLALYLCGDIPWRGPNSRPGSLLGVEQPYLAIWTELAAITRVPVFHIFCTYLSGGRFRLEIEGVGSIQPGEQAEAVADFLKQLEARIATYPTQAVAHLLWPCFHPVAREDPPSHRLDTRLEARPSRRSAASSH
jgi:phosphatidylinositol dimannoside acyltransferase